MYSGMQSADENDVAVIGFSGRFPGARTPAALWENLIAGVEATTFFSGADLEKSGIPRFIYNHPLYVRAYPLLEDADKFDAEFFSISPKEAQYIDPQQRLFLECAVEALEHAAYDANRFAGSIGVYAGSGTSFYYQRLIENSAKELSGSSGFKTMAYVGNDKDYIATRVSYKLNLRGPSLTVQTACSTSFVAVHLACQSILAGECDMALAGGASVTNHHKGGYQAVEGGLLSTDGHCRPFDENASGTVFGDGAGIVVLKSLRRALADGDTVWGVIKGSAINNDGSSKVSFTAPSIEQQAQVITEALSVAQVTPDTVGYIEAHGTGTVLGDPIEVAALTKAFRRATDRTGFCYLGSLKANVGHLVAASGVAGLIKVLLAFEHEAIPPLINCRQPNPEIDFDRSPFILNTQPVEWRRGAAPRRAGVSSFGVGGTNAHLVVQEPPSRDSSPSTCRHHLLVLSAKGEASIAQVKANLANYLRDPSSADLADVAFTLSIGRTAHRFAEVVFCDDKAGAIAALTGDAPFNTMSALRETRVRPRIAFMFPGQGSQLINMGRDLYEDAESVFRAAVDRCLDIVRALTDIDLLAILYPSPDAVEPGAGIHETAVAQPVIFIVSYALSQHWMALGIQPDAMVGHSIGEFVAACLAGVFSLEDALRVVTNRARLMQDCPRGAMLAIMAPAGDWEDCVSPSLAMASINGPRATVLSGATEDIAESHQTLLRRGIVSSVLKTSHAYHSPMMAPAASALRSVLQTVQFHPPALRFVSNVTGGWVDPAMVCTPEYWERHLLSPVRFAENVRTLVDDGINILLEVGAGRTLCSLSQQNTDDSRTVSMLTSLPHAGEVKKSAEEATQRALAQLWLQGVEVDWAALFRNERRRRVPLPTYPFQRKQFSADSARKADPETVAAYMDHVFRLPTWHRLPPVSSDDKARQLTETWLVFADDRPLSDALLQAVRPKVGTLVTVRQGDWFDHMDDVTFRVEQGNMGHLDLLFATLKAGRQSPDRIVYLWATDVADGVAGLDAQGPGTTTDRSLELAFFTPLHLARAVGQSFPTRVIEFDFVGSGTHEIVGADLTSPIGAMLLGVSLVIPEEYTEFETRFIDIPSTGTASDEEIAGDLLQELLSVSYLGVVGLRGGYRWARGFDRTTLPVPEPRQMPLRPQGVYLITGGLGDLGLAMGRFLAKQVQAKLVLVGRTALSPSEPGMMDSRTARLTGEIAALEQLGAEVMVVAADISDTDAVFRLARDVEARFGPVHGVVHAAGVAGTSPIGLTERADAMAVLAPKVVGLANIERAFAASPLDFLALFSSVNAVHGQVGQVAYAAGNIYLDAVAAGRVLSCAKLVISINWDAWSEIGMAVNTPLPAKLREFRREALRWGLLTSEGVDAFARILGQRIRRVVVSFRDMNVEKTRKYRARLESETAVDGETAQGTAPPRDRNNWSPRPSLAQAYVAPQNEIEVAVTDIWMSLLQLQQVGTEDDFFDLGGHSLLALQLIPRLRERFQVDVTPLDLFGAPTVSRLVLLIEARMVDDVLRMDDDEVEKMLVS